jgi:hypothetical protein
VADAFANYPATQRMTAFLEGVQAFHRFAPTAYVNTNAVAADDQHGAVMNALE